MTDEALSKPTKRRKKKAREAAPAAAPISSSSAKRNEPPAKSGGMAGTFGVAAVALAVGVGAGWYVRDAKAKEADGGTTAVAPVGSAEATGVCASWATKICGETGDESEVCESAKSAADLLPDGACTQALTDVPATLAKAKAMRSTCEELADKLCNDLGAETESCKMVKVKTPTFPAAQCKEMLGHYAEVLGELQKQEKLRQPLSDDLAKKIGAADAPSFGPADAKVTLVLFSDFECPYCSMAAETLDTLKEKYEGRVRFVFRQFPLSFHKNAQLAAEASLAAHAQGKFWAFHDKVFKNQDKLGREGLEAVAQEVGLDMAAFKKALDEHTYADAVKKDMTMAEDVPVGGTPTIVVGTKRVENPSVEAISETIDAQLGA